MINILITGVSGLLGYELTKIFLSKPKNFVFGISRKPIDLFTSKFQNLVLDFNDYTFVNKLPRKIDVIIHLAQSENFRDFPAKGNNIFNVNVISTQRLLDYALKVECNKFVYASSGGIYGFGRTAFSEELKVELNNNLGFYLTSKLMGELLVRNYSQFLNTLILRPFFIYGKRQNRNMLIPRLFDNVKYGRPIVINKSGGININPIHVTDAAFAIEKLIELNQQGVFNIGGFEVMSIEQISNLIADLIGIKPNFVLNEEISSDLIADIQKIKSLGIMPKISLKEGLIDLNV